MTSQPHTLELVFATSTPEDANALLARLNALSAAGTGLQLTELDCSDALGATRTQKVITVVATLTLDLGVGLLASVVYDALKANPETTCVVGSATVVIIQPHADLGEVQSQLSAAARPATPTPPAAAPR